MDNLKESRFAALEAVEKIETDYIRDYEWTDGESGFHIPTETERLLIEDAIAGLHADERFVAAWDAWRALCRSTAMDDVIAERLRQVSAKGYTFKHDDEHDECELAMAAAAYVEHAINQDGNIPGFWPWLDEEWSPKDRRRDLVCAAALIVAEVERLDRAANARAKPAE